MGYNLLFLLFIEFIARMHLINTSVFPAPTDILFHNTVLKQVEQLMSSFNLVIIIFLVSVVINIIITAFIYLFHLSYLEKMMYRFNGIPKIIITLLGIAVLGVGYRTIIVVTLLSTITNFVITVLGYLRNNINQDLIDAAKNAGANPLQTLIFILFPSNLQGILIASKLSMIQVLNGVIMGEYLIGNKGIGSLLQFNLSQYHMKNVWMLVVIIYTFSLLVNYLFDTMIQNERMWYNEK